LDIVHHPWAGPPRQPELVACPGISDKSRPGSQALTVGPGFVEYVRLHVLPAGGEMQKKLTITIDERVYEGLHNVVGRRRISRFIESLVRPHVIGEGLEAAYRQMALEEGREAEASEWADGTSGDVGDEAR
jgi:predicted CopG family antitoxin